MSNTRRRFLQRNLGATRSESLPSTSLFLTGVSMISAGFETTAPIPQTRTVVIQGARETSGRGWVLEVHSPQGAAAFLPHVHRTWTETLRSSRAPRSAEWEPQNTGWQQVKVW